MSIVAIIKMVSNKFHWPRRDSIIIPIKKILKILKRSNFLRFDLPKKKNCAFDQNDFIPLLKCIQIQIRVRDFFLLKFICFLIYFITVITLKSRHKFRILCVYITCDNKTNYLRYHIFKKALNCVYFLVQGQRTDIFLFFF